MYPPEATVEQDRLTVGPVVSRFQLYVLDPVIKLSLVTVKPSTVTFCMLCKLTDTAPSLLLVISSTAPFPVLPEMKLAGVTTPLTLITLLLTLKEFLSAEGNKEPPLQIQRPVRVPFDTII